MNYIHSLYNIMWAHFAANVYMALLAGVSEDGSAGFSNTMGSKRNEDCGEKHVANDARTDECPLLCVSCSCQ